MYGPAHTEQTGPNNPSAARSSPLAPRRPERPPNRDGRLRPVGHTHSGRSRSLRDSTSTNQSPKRLWANPELQTQGRKRTSASLGAGPRARTASATPAHRADILVDLSGFSRRVRSLAWVGGGQVQLPPIT